MIITNIKQGVKNPNRVNVFVDGKYNFSLDMAQVVDLGVKVGREISVDELAEFKKASDFGKLYQRTLEWMLIRPRSVNETKDYLIRKVRQSSVEKSSESITRLCDSILCRLENKGYLDDKKFAEWYAENRFVKKGISKKRLKMELMKKGISREIIDEVLDSRDDEEEIKKIIIRKRAKYDEDKLTTYLVRQGFSYDLVRKMMQEARD